MSELEKLAAPLHYFIAVAQAGSFTAAAKELSISQPSLSVAVKKLEAAVGTSLLHRSRSGVQPTRAGEILLDHSRRADQILETAVLEILALDEHPRGRFTIGAHESLAGYFLPGFMSSFFQEFPDVELELLNGNSRDVEDAVVARRIDVGLVVNPRRHPDCVVRSLFEDRVGLVASASLTHKHSTEALLHGWPLIHVPVLEQTRHILAEVGDARSGRELTCSSMELVKSLVIDHVGIGILPYRVASYGLPAGRLVRLDNALPIFDDVITLVRRYDMAITAGARVLLDRLLSHAESIPKLSELVAVQLS